MQLENENSISVLVGNPHVAHSQDAWKPFDERVINYLTELSRRVLAIPNIREFPDLVSLAYWCRSAALQRLSQRHKYHDFVIGRGLAFHIPPSNVPLNFAYSLFCGLLSGNSNIVRLSSTEAAEVATLVDVINSLYNDATSDEVSARVCLLRYEHDDSITRSFSLCSAARIIWGGNETVRKIRGIESAPRSVDVAFADRVSVALINSDHVNELSDDALTHLVDLFIADGYTFGQNACSSPRLVIWHGTPESVHDSSSRFWTHLEERLRLKDTLSPAHHMLRFVELCEHLSIQEFGHQLKSVNGAAARFDLNSGASWRDYSHLRFGTFTEVTISELQEVASLVSADVQTLSYVGCTTGEMNSIIEEIGIDGIDRIVPIGQALNFDTFWDGYDLIRSLTRTVVII
jgi:hypothetical protein